MFQLAVRMWTEGGMLYPTKFSVMYDTSRGKSSVRAILKNDKFISEEYMLITPFMAINGPIFEKDIIIVDGNEDILRLVMFSMEAGAYHAINIKDEKDILVMTASHGYETAGNIYEDPYLLEDTKFGKGKESLENNEAEVICEAASQDDTKKVLANNNTDTNNIVRADAKKNDAAEAFEPKKHEIQHKQASAEKTLTNNKDLKNAGNVTGGQNNKQFQKNNGMQQNDECHNMQNKTERHDRQNLQNKQNNIQNSQSQQNGQGKKKKKNRNGNNRDNQNPQNRSADTSNHNNRIENKDNTLFPDEKNNKNNPVTKSDIQENGRQVFPRHGDAVAEEGNIQEDKQSTQKEQSFSEKVNVQGDGQAKVNPEEDTVHPPVKEEITIEEKNTSNAGDENTEKILQKEEPMVFENSKQQDVDNMPKDTDTDSLQMISVNQDIYENSEGYREEDQSKGESAAHRQDIQEVMVQTDEPDESDYIDPPSDEKTSEQSACKNTTGVAVKASVYFVSTCYDDNGSYVFSIISNDMEETYFGKEDNTNPRKIVLQGIIDALATFEGIFNITVYTDSQYVIYPFIKGWINKWKNSNWYKNETDRIQNYELWEQLLELSNKMNVKWEIADQSNERIRRCMNVLENNS